jgi:hypothetical protein
MWSNRYMVKRSAGFANLRRNTFQTVINLGYKRSKFIYFLLTEALQMLRSGGGDGVNPVRVSS